MRERERGQSRKTFNEDWPVLCRRGGLVIHISSDYHLISKSSDGRHLKRSLSHFLTWTIPFSFLFWIYMAVVERNELFKFNDNDCFDKYRSWVATRSPLFHFISLVLNISFSWGHGALLRIDLQALLPLLFSLSFLYRSLYTPKREKVASFQPITLSWMIPSWPITSFCIWKSRRITKFSPSMTL